jgi:hypothetical protein
MGVPRMKLVSCAWRGFGVEGVDSRCCPWSTREGLHLAKSSRLWGLFGCIFLMSRWGAAGRGWRGELGNRGWPSDHYSAVAVTGSAADVSVVRAAEIGGT